MEASAFQAPAAIPQTRVTLGAPLLRFRSDEQLVALFRAGDDDAFRAIHERYHKRLFAYTRQMLPARQDAEDALQDVFIRAYSGLRASDRELALRAWLFRVAHNRCIDELRRPALPPPEVLQLVRVTIHDPLAEVDLRESLRRLIEDIRRLPEHQRSALLMRELGGMSYADLAASLDISVGAVKSLLVRARMGLAQASAARDTACGLIREQLIEAHDRGIRPDANARRHIRDCTGCKSFRRELRGVSRQLAAVAPAVGPLGFLAKLLGFSGGGGAGGGAALIGGGGGATASAGSLAIGVNHVATLIVAAVATAGGAVELQHTIIAPAHHPAHTRHHARRSVASSGRAEPVAVVANTGAAGIQEIARVVAASVSNVPTAAPGASNTTTPVKPKARKNNADRTDVSPPVTGLGSSTSPATRTSTLVSGTVQANGTSPEAGGSCSSVPASSSATATGAPGASSPTAASSTAGSASDTEACTLTGAGSTVAATSPSGTAGSGGSGSTTGGSGSTSSASPASGSASPGTTSGSGPSATTG